MNKTTLRIITIVPLCVLLVAIAMLSFMQVEVDRSVVQPAAVLDTESDALAFVAPSNAVVVDDTTSPSSDYQTTVRTAGDFLKMLTDTQNSTTYTLANDFVVTRSVWSNVNGYTSDHKFTIDGDGHSITYSPSQEVLSNSQYGGLFGQFSGTLKNLTYVFSGKLEACCDTAGKSEMIYGGFAGIFTGTIEGDPTDKTKCKFINQGTIMVYANKSECTIYTGGIAGKMSGATISNSTITISGSITASSMFEPEGETVTQATLKNKCYSGGIAADAAFANTRQTKIENCNVSITGTVYTHDNASKSHGNFGAWLSSIGQSKNSDGYVFPAGGLVATGTSLVLTSNIIGVSAKINSTGGEVSSKVGAISGGLVGLCTSSTYLSFSDNVFHLTGIVMASNERDSGSVFKGGFLGRLDGLANTSTLSHNAIYYNMSVPRSNIEGTDYYGYFCGNNGSTFKTFNDNTNWMVITGTDEIGSVTDIVNKRCHPDVDCGSTGMLIVYGGGSVSAEIVNNKITFYANQQYSPFYNWLSSIDGDAAVVYNKDTSTSNAYDVNHQPYTKYIFAPTSIPSSGKVYAVFLTQNIYSAGTFVQWTEEMNSGLNKRWIKANVTKDITVKSGVNIVNEFKGDFNGNGHTITFNSTSVLNGVANLKVDTDKGIDETTAVFGGTGDPKLEYASSGIFRTIGTNATVRNFTFVFSGKVYAGSDGDKSALSAAGALAGCNKGTISDITFTLPQAGTVTASGSTAYAGGLIGINYGTVDSVSAVIEGKVKASAPTCYAGGLIGADLQTASSKENSRLKYINLDVKGQITGYIRSDASAGRATTAGLVGKTSSEILFSYVVVNVRDASNQDGDVLVSACKHNTDHYQAFLSAVRGEEGNDYDFSWGAADAAVILQEIKEEELDKLCSARTTTTLLQQLIVNTQLAIDALNNGRVFPGTTQSLDSEWVNKNIVKVAERLDCNAPCAECESKCTASCFVSDLNNKTKHLNQVWAVGSYAQFAGDDEQVAGVRVLPYFNGVIENVPTVTADDYALNLIYVQEGTAACTFTNSGMAFYIPLEDSGHVFTGWFTDYTLSEMVAATMVTDNTFTPGTQSGSVWYSSVIASMLTTPNELKMLASTTNAGQTYAGITFTLGGNITVADAFRPIGTESHPFGGTFDGKGYAIILNGGFNTSFDTLGVFGCVGATGVVKQLAVKYNTTTKNINGRIFGLVCAVNNGTIGQNAQGDIRVYINCSTTGVAIGGGIVGINKETGVVRNAEVYFHPTEGSLHAGTSLLAYAEGRSAAAGAVAVNLGVVKNVQVSLYKSETINADGTISKPGVRGGIVGYNQNQVYSCVATIYAAEETTKVVNLGGDHSGVLLGYNQGNNIDSLWAVYCLSTEDDDDPYLVPSSQRLISGDNADIGNRLIRYGYGSIVTDIYANTALQLMGGSIQFSPAEDAVKQVPFYEFTQSLNEGKTVPGASGTYMPKVGSGESGDSGKTYYAVFAKSTIANENEYYDFVAHINSGFKAYVDYSVVLSGGSVLGLDARKVGYQSVGNGNNIFVGSFDAGSCKIEVTAGQSECDGKPLFGTIGSTSVVRNIDLSYGETINFRTGYCYMADGEHKNKYMLGAVAYVNKGTISNLELEFQAGLYGSETGFGTQGYADYVGVVAGYNCGHITNTKVRCYAGTYGYNVVSGIYGIYAGGIVGYNDGIIGSENKAGVTFTMDAGPEKHNTAIVGTVAAGGIAGYNAGQIVNINATVKGYIGTPAVVGNTIMMGYIVRSNSEEDEDTLRYFVEGSVGKAYVGGVVGINAGSVSGVNKYGVRVTVDAKAQLNSNGGYVGGVAGENRGETSSISAEDPKYPTSVTWASVYNENRQADVFGGIVGNNDGIVQNADVLLASSVIATLRAGGIAGNNSFEIRTSLLNVAGDVRLSAASSEGYAGGVVAYNEGRIVKAQVVVLGYLGSDATQYVGGFAGFTSSVVENSYVVLYHDLTAQSDYKGVAVACTDGRLLGGKPFVYGVNSWGVAFNSVRASACTTANSGFNVLKVVDSKMVGVKIAGTEDNPRIQFSTETTGVSWYSDIASLTYITGANGNPISGSTYLPDVLTDCVYHLCSYDLTIDNAADLGNVYYYVNNADLFYGVAFRLSVPITIPRGMTLQPIGTAEHPFTGIFDGNNRTITFESGSTIVGSEYSGIFGYVAESAVLRNFVVQVEEDVQIGSKCNYVGLLAGRIDGVVENVAVNLLSAPYSTTESAVVGALAGVVGANARFTNTWISIYNKSVNKAVGQDDSALQDRYNVLNVFGSGVLRFGIDPISKQFTFTVIENADMFDAWYDQFDNGVGGVFSGDSYGVYTDKTAAEILYKPSIAVHNDTEIGLHGKIYTASFINMIIRNAEDFYRFAQNINDYGVPGARFTMELGLGVEELELDLSRIEPIGTEQHPFQAIFDGTITHANASKAAYTLVLKNAVKDADYSGLFGKIGAGATIRNIIIKADTSVAQTLGNRTSIYTGFLAAVIEGEEGEGNQVKLDGVVVSINSNTTLINGHSDAIGSIAGMWGRNIQAVNTWAVVPEFCHYGIIGSYRTDSGLYTYVEGQAPQGMPSTMYLCGEGELDYTHIRVDSFNPNEIKCKLIFSLSDTSNQDSPAFGFIEKYDTSEHEKSGESEPTFQTDGALDTWHDKVYLALYLKSEISTAADLQRLAQFVEQGRNYPNVVYRLLEDITLSTGDWTPIGGSIPTAENSQEFIQVPFAGILDGQDYNGKVHTITMPQGLTTDAEYAGLFGILAPSAKICNLYVVCEASIGDAETSQYAGALAGIDQGATLQNIIITIKTTASLKAKLSTGRVAVNQALTYNVDGEVTNYKDVAKAQNVWVLSYNSHYTVSQNEAEAAFNLSIPDDWANGNAFAASGSYNGGVNVITLIARGEVTVTFETNANKEITGIALQQSIGNPVREWYYFDENGDKQPCGEVFGSSINTQLDNDHRVVYASFVQSNIDSLAALVKLGLDVDFGCDLYAVTFTLETDLVINSNTLSDAGSALGITLSAFAPIGTDADRAFNAIFDGQGHTITLDQGIVVTGAYAGIFGCTGDDAVLKNLKLALEGTLGTADSTYAGAIAYNQGKLDSVIIDATQLTLLGQTVGSAIGYDEKNLHANTWLFVKASDKWMYVDEDNKFAPVGGVKGGTTSTINVMTVIGMGALTTQFVVSGDDYYVKMFNADPDHKVLGWYNDFARDNQLSAALNITPQAYPDITAGVDGCYVASNSSAMFERRYEVVIISNVITKEEELIMLAKDVNQGGYTFANTTFTLGKDIEISSMDFVSIGTASTPFEGTLQGGATGSGNYYVITMQRQDALGADQGIALFGVNNGTIENLIVRQGVNIGSSSEVGVIAKINEGTIANCMVAMVPVKGRVSPTIELRGSTVGGIAGINYGTVQNCVVYVSEKATITAGRIAGGLVGQNEGDGVLLGSYGGTNSELDMWNTVWNNSDTDDTDRLRTDYTNGSLLWASVLLRGKIEVVNNNDDVVLRAGGAVGYSGTRATVNHVSVIVTGTVYGRGYNVELGGLAGQSLSALVNCTVIFEGTMSYQGAQPTSGGVPIGLPQLKYAYAGYFVGEIQGNAENSWLVARASDERLVAVGVGTSINVLKINGKGDITSYIDRNNNILFENNTPADGAKIDGWYLSSGLSAANIVGGVDEDSFAPNRTVLGTTVTVVFISRSIETAEELIAMAQTVNAGLFASDLNFELNASFTVNVDTYDLLRSLAIGTAAHPFNHFFEGNGNTITFEMEGSAANIEYLGLFGYTGTGATIQNLNIIIRNGNYGVEGSTLAVGAIAGVNYGIISNCNVTLGSAVTSGTQAEVAPAFVGVRVGGLVGANYGSINGCTLVSYAVLRSSTASSYDSAQYAGGVAGVNDGTIDDLIVDLNGSVSGGVAADNSVIQKYKGTAYVGGIVGNNMRGISNVILTVKKGMHITSLSNGSSYAGGVVGNNMGTVSRVYVDWETNVSLTSNHMAGGITGGNNNKLSNILLVYADGCTPAERGDSAVGNTGTSGIATNVWVFNHSDRLDSNDDQINNMTTDPVAPVTHSDAAEVLAGTIRFYAAIDAGAGFTAYANRGDGYRSVLLDDFVSYYDTVDGKTLLLNANDFVPTANRTALSVRVVVRRSLHDQSEFKAIAKCLAADNGQAINGTYTVAEDITVTDTFRSLGTASRPFAATLTGGMNAITFASDVVFDNNGASALFEYLSGNVSQLLIRIDCVLSGSDAAGIALHNNGSLDTVIVYAAAGVRLDLPTYGSDSLPTWANKNIWVVTREEVSQETGGVFGVIVVHGPGSVDPTYKNNQLSFTAVPVAIAQGEIYKNTFAGWGYNEELIRSDATMAIETAHAGRMYTAEFISTNIATDADLQNLLGLLQMNYNASTTADGTKETYYITADITVNSSDMVKWFDKFGGILVGNFHTLTLVGDQDQVFGDLSAELRNIVIDATAILGGSTQEEAVHYLFGNGSKAVLHNVVFYTSGRVGYLQGDDNSQMTLENVYMAKTDAAWKNHYRGRKLSDVFDVDNLGLLVYGAGSITYGLQDGRFYLDTQGAVGDTYFAGWVSVADVKTGFVAETKLDLVATQRTKAYRITYVNAVISGEGDLTLLAEAVNAGRDFASCAFTMNKNFSYAASALTIGSGNHCFAGSLDGAGYSLTATDASAAPLFDNLAGSVRNLVFYTSSQGIANTVSGTMQNVVVAFSTSTEDASAVFAGAATGDLQNTWLVAEGGINGNTVAAIKVLMLQATDKGTVKWDRYVPAGKTEEEGKIFVVDGVVRIYFHSEEVENFMVWRNADGTVKNVSNYNYISSDVDVDSYYSVEATNEINSTSEYIYFAQATAKADFSQVALLTADIVLDADTLQPLQYVFNLDGQGHTITIRSSASLCLVDEDSADNSSINNVILKVEGSTAALTLCRQADNVGSCTFNNVVVLTQSNTQVSWANCTCNNVWWLHSAAVVEHEDMEAAYALPVGINVLRYDLGTFKVVFNKAIVEQQTVYTISVQAIEMDSAKRSLHFLGFYSYEVGNEGIVSELTLTGNTTDQKRYQAFFASPAIASLSDWTHAADVMRLAQNSHFDYYLTHDIDANASFVPFLGYNGTLDGRLHSILLHGGVGAKQVVQLVDGTVSNLAVEVYYDYAVEGGITWFETTGNGSVSNCWIVNDTANVLAHADGIRVMTIHDEDNSSAFKSQKDGTGIDIFDVDGAFVFVAKDKLEYRLHYYIADDTHTQYEADDWAEEIFAIGKTMDITAQFNKCFTITVAVDGIDSALIAARNADDCILSSTKYLWSTDVAYDVEYRDLGSGNNRKIFGYVFLGFSIDPESASDGIEKSSLVKWTVPQGFNKSVTITAHFMQITSDWNEIRFGDLTLDDTFDYLTVSDKVKEAVAALPVNAEISYPTVQADADVKDTELYEVSPGNKIKLPYHAGGYIIKFSIYYRVKVSVDPEPEEYVTYYLGFSDGLSLRIAERELYFERIEVTNKKYDGTAVITDMHVELGGFSSDSVRESELKGQVSTSGISLMYYDASANDTTANAGKWNVIVSPNSYLTASTLNSPVLFDSDYKLPQGILYLHTVETIGDQRVVTKAEEAYTASILKQDLEMEVLDISMDYLEQFGRIDDNGEYATMNIHDKFLGGVSIHGFVNEADEQNLKSKAVNLLRIVGDSAKVDSDGNVVSYSYRLRQPGTYYIEVIDDALDNYEPHISAKKATLTVLPSKVSVKLGAVADADGEYTAANTVQYGEVPASIAYELYYGGAQRLPLITLQQGLVANGAGAYANIDETDWFGVKLEPVAAYQNDAAVAFGGVDIGPVGIVYRYSAANTALVLDEATMKLPASDEEQAPIAEVKSDYDANNKLCYLVAQKNALLVVRREVTYQVTSSNTKTFGSDDTDIKGQVVGKKGLVGNDKLVFSRQAGELVGNYTIYVSVRDAAGKDVTKRYQLLPNGGNEFAYTITKRVVVVRRTGSGSYYYGSSELSKMPYSTGLSNTVKKNIMTYLGSTKPFDSEVSIQVGYFGSELQNVRSEPYNTVSLRYSYNSDFFSAELAESCMTFVLDESSAAYVVLRAPLTVKLGTVKRKYDSMLPIGEEDINAYLREKMRVTVTGWVGNHSGLLEVKVVEFACNKTPNTVGSYTVVPTKTVIAYKSGSGTLNNNYTVDSITAGTYTIESIDFTITAKAGTYDEYGAFTPAEVVLFGDPANKWYFQIDYTKLPDYLRKDYVETFFTTDEETGETIEIGSDWQKTQWLRTNLDIVATDIGALAPNTIVKEGDVKEGANKYTPYSSNRNITIKLDSSSNFTVLPVNISLYDIKVTASSVKSHPVVSFKVKVTYQSADYTYDVTDTYCDSSVFSKISEGEAALLNDSVKLVVSYAKYTYEDCVLSFTPYLNNGLDVADPVQQTDDWRIYDQVINNAVVTVPDAEGNDVAASNILTDVTVNPGLWETLGEVFGDNAALVVVGVIGGLLLVIGGAILGGFVYRQGRLRRAVMRTLRNEEIFARMQQNAQQQEDEWVEDSDEFASDSEDETTFPDDEE